MPMSYRERLDTVDQHLIACIKGAFMPFARITLFIIFFWFGILKVLGTSPANPLVANLLHATLPFLTFNQFIIGFGIFEMIIGVTFLIPRMERLAMALLIPHMVTTVLPLFLLPEITWSGLLIPTLEGQYIIKNLALIGLAFGIAAHLTPWKRAVSKSTLDPQ